MHIKGDLLKSRKQGLIFYKTIKFRLTVFFCIVTIILAVLASWAIFNYQKNSLIHQLKTRAATLVESLAVNARAPLLAEDLMQLSVLVSTECKRTDILWAAVIDHNGKVLMHSEINEIGKNFSNEYGAENWVEVFQEDKFLEIKPIVINEKKIGNALLSMDAGPVFRRIREFRLGILAAFFLSTILVCFSFIHIIAHSLKPLDSLSQAVSKVGQGDLRVRIQENGGEEICKLAQAFNKMTENLEQANRRIQEGYLQAVMALAAAVEAKDPYTRGHCDRVGYYSEKTARQMGLNESTVMQLRLAGQLHDIGKIGVEKKILHKDSFLTPEEFAKMAQHPQIAWKILEPAEFLSEAREAILAHHERYDGKGYPRGLSMENICLAGRILAVADSYDAMTSDRPYRHRFEKNKALEIIRKEKGKQFDPKVVEAFMAAQRNFEDRTILDEPLRLSDEERIWKYSEIMKRFPGKVPIKQKLKKV